MTEPEELAAARSAIAISDRYRITRELGHGGMATVYGAIDVRYDREVAVKVLDSDLAAGIAAERFLREIAVVARLTHPHIVPLLDSGETDGRLWFVMPLLEGDTLRARLEREKQLPVGEAVRISHDVARALAYAHAHGVVHRDIKPENVLISGGSAAVSDFGLVKVIANSDASGLTRTGIAVGTTYYMSPEQSSGADVVDGRTDIYGLGCMLYEMLTGEPPFTGTNAQSVIAKHFTDPVPKARRLRETVSEELDAVIARAMAKVPADRWSDATAMAEALERTLDSGSKAIHPMGESFATNSADAHSAQPGASRRRTMLSITGVAVLVVAAGFGVKALVASRESGADPAGSVAMAGIPRSIAVLPFTNLSTSIDEEYFSAGMTDELIGALSTVEGLRVAARSSSNAFKGRTSEHREIGEKLNVEAVIEGSVRREGDQVRILVELVSVADGTSLWRQQYDRTLSGVFALQEEIAQAIAGAMRIQLIGARTLVQRNTEDVAAYQLYLRGRYAWNQRTKSSLQQAATWFRQAVDLDPQYARAWAGIADVHIVQALNFYAPPKENYAQAKATILKALALDSTLAEAHASLGTLYFLYDRDWDAADASYRRALTLDSTYSAGYYFYALFLSAQRRDTEALVAAQRAMTLDPLAPPIAQVTGIILLQDGQYANAIAPLRSAIALQPQYYFPHTWLSLALALTGANAEAVVEAKRAAELAPDNALVQAIVGYVYALTGDRSAALAVIAELETQSRTQTIPFHYVSRIYDVLGDGPRALDWLQRSLDAREGQLSQLLCEPRMRTIGNDPRYLQILKQLNLR